MPRAKLDLKRAKVQIILQMEDPDQEYAWQRVEEMRSKGTLQAFLRRIIVAALPRPATPKANGRNSSPARPEPRYDKLGDE